MTLPTGASNKKKSRGISTKVEVYYTAVNVSKSLQGSSLDLNTQVKAGLEV